MLPFNVPAIYGTESEWIQEAVRFGQLSGNGPMTKAVARDLESRFGFHKVLLTHSCTGALEMTAMLLNLGPGDEVILPSFTHVGTANAFARTGATLCFADSLPNHPNIDPAEVARLISPRTKAVVVVHYAGQIADIPSIKKAMAGSVAVLIEDAAHATGATQRGNFAGRFGEMAAFSFHETKNIHCGQGGMLVLPDDTHVPRAQRILENGTNRADFYSGKVNHYTWVDPGSCFLLSELQAAFLRGQMDGYDILQNQRMQLWERYYAAFEPLEWDGKAKRPVLFPENNHNGHIFYLTLESLETRDRLMAHMHAAGILAVFHYIPLHSSPFFHNQYRGPELRNCQAHSEHILRLPLYYGLTPAQHEQIINSAFAFFQS